MAPKGAGGDHGSNPKALLNAVRARDEEEIARLLSAKEAGQSVAFHDPEDGTFPLFWAASNGDDGTVRLLVDKKANVNETDFELEKQIPDAAFGGRTALMIAAAAGCRGAAAVTTALLDKKADIGLKDIHGMTALHCAAQGGFLDVVKVLVERSADLEARDGTAETAGASGRPPWLKMIGTKYTPLHRCAAMGTLRHAEVCRELLRAKADPKAKTGFEESALQIARHHSPTRRVIAEYTPTFHKAKPA